MFKNVFKNKRVLITGHTGFKGAWLSQWLLNLGAEIGGFSIDVPTRPALFDLLKLKKSLRDIRGDIRELSSLQKVFTEFQPEIVFHLAAQPLVRLSYDDPKGTFDTNISGTVNVLECIRKNESVEAAVIVATDKCYENLESLEGYRETDRLGGADPYSASKACAEIVFSSYQKSFFSKMPHKRIASVRAGNVIGGGDWALDRLVPDCIRAWQEGKVVSIRSPNAVRPWQHVLEPLSGYLKLASYLYENKKDVVGQSFNFGPKKQNQKDVLSLIQTCQKYWDDARWEIVDSSYENKKETGILMLNCQKAHQILQWSPKLDFDETIKQTVSWYQLSSRDTEATCNLTQEQISSYLESD